MALVGGAGATGGVAPTFRPAGQVDLAPVGVIAKARANLAALDVLAALSDEGRPATAGEQGVLARWSGWGAVPSVFDEQNTEMAELRARFADRRIAELRQGIAESTEGLTVKRLEAAVARAEQATRFARFRNVP